MLTLSILILLTFATVVMVVLVVVPFTVERSAKAGKRRVNKLTQRMERVLMKQDAQLVSRLYVLAPVVMTVAGYMFSPEGVQIFGALIGLVFGFLFPSMYFKALLKKRKAKFNDQLIDALMIMSSSFRGGLSLIQAIEAVVEEMPEPISQEFSMVLNENKMGVSLDDSLNHLYARMPSPHLQQTQTAILLARETGGNLPLIFTRIVNSIREHKKIQQNIDTLTLQGKIQGVVMSLLPLGFAVMVTGTNPDFFKVMYSSDMGKTLLISCFFLWVVGAFLIWKISTYKEF